MKRRHGIRIKFVIILAMIGCAVMIVSTRVSHSSIADHTARFNTVTNETLEGCLKCHDQIEPMHRYGPTATLDKLVPAYLPELPLDPHSGRPLLYRAAAADFLLYSVGKDRIDNGGHFTNAKSYLPTASPGQSDRGYDFDLDTFTRP